MPFDPHHFGVVASNLSRQLPCTGEAAYRTIAGRVYYASYLATREAIRVRHGLSDDYRPGHEDLCNQLATFADTEVRDLGNRLNSLRMMRVKADYNLRNVVYEHDADNAADDYEPLLALLAQVTQKLPRVPG